MAVALVVKPQPIPLQWDTDEPIWVEQWPLPSHKLDALKIIVEQQLKEGHIEPGTSPYNSPSEISVYKIK